MASEVHNSTTSSVIGNYLHLKVQVTKDSQPVVYDGSLLPVSEFQLNVEDVSLAEFEALAFRLKRGPNGENLPPDSLVQVAQNWMGSLVSVLQASLYQSLRFKQFFLMSFAIEPP
jgi:CDK inhibitor PHO81